MAEFLYRGAELPDDWRFADWLDLLAEDLAYFMPIRRHVKFDQHIARQNTRQAEAISWFNENKWTLNKRVEQTLTQIHSAEEPLPRTTHLVSNVRLLSAPRAPERAPEVEVSCQFLTRQNRVEYAIAAFIRRRRDRLRRQSGNWRIARREILPE